MTGRRPDLDTLARIREIRAQLKEWGHAGTLAQVAAVLSIERGERVTADSVRGRLRCAKEREQ